MIPLDPVTVLAALGGALGAAFVLPRTARRTRPAEAAAETAPEWVSSPHPGVERLADGFHPARAGRLARPPRGPPVPG